jgi:hypothetical protein
MFLQAKPVSPEPAFRLTELQPRPLLTSVKRQSIVNTTYVTVSELP